MDSKYQYSSLFTSGLLTMMPRGGSVENVPPSKMENEPTLSRRRSANSTTQIMVSIPGTSPQRRIAQRRPSSMLLHLSPQSTHSSPVQAFEDSWDRIKRFGDSSSPVSEMRMPAQTSNHLLSLASTQERVETMEAHEYDYATLPEAATRTRGQSASQGLMGMRKPVSPKPKPAPTSPLPELPNARTGSGTKRTPFGAIQAQT